MLKRYLRMQGLLALILCIATFATAREAYDGRVIFRNETAPESTLTIGLGAWTDAEIEFVSWMLDELDKFAPGLFARATQAAPLSLYRTADDSPSHPAAAWARRRHENSLIFRDDFFKIKRRNHLGVDYSYWLFIHEIAHLADPVDQLGQSADWMAVVEPRIDDLTAHFAAEGKSLRDAMFAFLNDPAIERELPSTYAAISPHEALAEYTTAAYFRSVFAMPDDVTRILQAQQFSPPSEQDIANSTAYRTAYTHYRNKANRRAAATLSAVLKEDPNFAMGYYLRGYAQAARGRFRDAKEDWTRALELVPAKDTPVTSELKAGIAFADQKLGN